MTAGQARRPEEAVFEGLFFKRFRLRTCRVLAAAQRLDIVTMAPVAGVMARVVVDLCTTEALERLELPPPRESTLRGRLRVVLTHLDPAIASTPGRGRRLSAAWTDSQDDDAEIGLTCEPMNSYVDIFTRTRGSNAVRSLSEAYRPLLVDLDGSM